MRVLLTGASGLIGQYAVRPLIESGCEVFCVSSSLPTHDAGRRHWIHADLLSLHSIKEVISYVSPTHLLHFAWETKAQTYLEDRSNFDWLHSSFELLKQFYSHGGTRAVCAGTCFEYGFKNEPLREDMALNPTSTYAKCKNILRQTAELYAEKMGFSFAWGRIFYTYGEHEQPERLVPHLIENLSKNRPVSIRSPQLVKDYLFAGDVAAAFVALLSSDATGCFNICSGIPIKVGDLATEIARHYGREDLLEFQNEPTSQPPMILGDNSRLVKEVGFEQNLDPRTRLISFLNSGLNSIWHDDEERGGER
ncbi:MAG: NAD(P)-dependent oxidoreductase [Planctomycetia bacterium]|nr:NAD(P)-dependent oxidoreductase [Planctomycetia bacterium]